MQLSDYKNKIVVVTGCYSGIGRATAELLLLAGAEVHGLDRNSPDYNLPHFHQADFLDRSSLDKVLTRLPYRIDALFNCAGLGPSHPDDQVFGVNFLATRYVTEQLVPRMPTGSAIVSIASIGGMAWPQRASHWLTMVNLASDEEAWQWFINHPVQSVDAYSCSKEALVVWTKWQSTQLIKRGIRINCTAPGATQTRMLEEIERDLPQANVDRVAEPFGRRSSPAEQAWPLLMLNSEQAGYINGVNLAVDGGAEALLTLGPLKP